MAERIEITEIIEIGGVCGLATNPTDLDYLNN